jgi:hypothetical protein
MDGCLNMVADAIRCLNQFPHANGISSTLSPTGIVTGVAPPDYIHMRVEFGSYTQVFEDNDPSNTLRSRSLSAIALTLTSDAQGNFYFLSLAFGHQTSRHNWTSLPMTDSVIARVHALALHEDQPLLQHSGMVVEWRHDQPIDDFAYDKDYAPPATQRDLVFDADDYDAIEPHEIDYLLAAGPPPYLHGVPLDGVAAVPQGAIMPNKNYEDHNNDEAYNTEYNADDDEDDAEEEGAPRENHNDDEEGAPLAAAPDNDDDEETHTAAAVDDDAEDGAPRGGRRGTQRRSVQRGGQRQCGSPTERNAIQPTATARCDRCFLRSDGRPT